MQIQPAIPIPLKLKLVEMKPSTAITEMLKGKFIWSLKALPAIILHCLCGTLPCGKRKQEFSLGVTMGIFKEQGYEFPLCGSSLFLLQFWAPFLLPEAPHAAVLSVLCTTGSGERRHGEPNG